MSRFVSPLIMKVSFTKPSATNQKKNAAHVKYIGTRPGVERSQNEIHVKYLNERPGSHGLFGKDPDPIDLKEIQNEIKHHQGLSWRFVLSLREEDALRLGFENRDKWESTLRSTMPTVAHKLGISESNLRWVAAFHKEKGHPHAHILLWEKNPQRIKGKLSRDERIAIKREFMKEIYAEERVRLAQERTAMRDLIRDYAKDDIQKAIQIRNQVKDIQEDLALDMQASGQIKPGLAPTPYKDELIMISQKIQQLVEIMPGSGRAVYAYMPPHVKEKTNDIVKNILDMPVYRPYVKSYLDAVDSLTRLHTSNLGRINLAMMNAMKDLEKRIGNLLIRAAAKIERSNSDATLQRSNSDSSLNSRIRGNETHYVSGNQVFVQIYQAIQIEQKKIEAKAERERRKLALAQKKQKQHER